jgi:hypothetical protein
MTNADEGARVDAQILGWGEPPPPAKGKPRTQWQTVYDGVMARPGESAYLGDFPKSGPGQFPAGPFRQRGITVTTRVRADDHSRVDVWAKYQPGPSPESPLPTPTEEESDGA